MKLELLRLSDNREQTEGHLYLYENNKIIWDCVTLELPWKQNKNSISCIDYGIYDVVKRKDINSQFNYEHLHILNVVGRKWILMHGGNYSRQIRGCILLGDKHIDIDGDGLIDVTNSRKVLRELLELIPDKIKLEIKYRT